MPNSFEISSVLDADRDAVWAHASSARGVQHELSPWFRMTFPSDVTSFTPENVTLGEPLFRSVLLLFGVLPLDWDDVTFVEIDPGRGFVERSTMASQRVWEHERFLEDVAGGTRITDRLRWEGRFPGAAALFGLLVPRLFTWRHRQLQKIFAA